jgi:hypothetical protein
MVYIGGAVRDESGGDENPEGATEGAPAAG